MDKTTPKIVQISDIVQWNEKKEIELSPRYQRNNVWNEKAKSYLIDTIIRGLPIPPIFLRQEIDVYTKTTSREIIDGQQRIRAILEYVIDEKFAIKKSHNREFGGKKYSDLDIETQEAILSYAILAEVVSVKDEGVLYDMFARLNSNNYVLNKQEIRNSKYWGDFKVLVYNLASKYRDFFLSYNIMSDNDCTRMRDAELITSMVIIMLEGIVSETPGLVDKIYEKYDSSFENEATIEEKYYRTMEVLTEIYSYFNGNLNCLTNKNYFFTLFSVIFHQMYGINGLEIERNQFFNKDAIKNNINKLLDCCVLFLTDYSNLTSGYTVNSDWVEFKKNHSMRTTSKKERVNRISFLNRYFTK